MNLSELSVIIQNLKVHGFTSTVEKLLAVVLASLNEGLQQCEIVEVLGLNERHCRDTLHKLANEELLKITGKRDIFYSPTQLLVKPHHSHSGGQHPHGGGQHRHSGGQHRHSGGQHRHSDEQHPHSGGQHRSPAHVNMLTLVNSTELNKTNKHEIENLNNSQAKDVAGSGKRKTADRRQQTAADASGQSTAAPPPSAAVCNLPSAVSSAQGTGTDTDVRRTSVADSAFSAQSPNPLPPNPPIQAHRSEVVSEAAQNPAKTKESHRTAHVAVYDELLTNPDHTKAVLASNRKRIKHQDTADYIPGTVFCTDNPADSLYQMLANLALTTSLDPKYHLRTPDEIIENLDKAPEYIKAESAFTKYYNIFWSLLGHVENGRKTLDCIIHRAAYVFVILDREILAVGPEFQSPETLIKACSLQYPKQPYTKLSWLLRDLYLDLEFGWHDYLLPNKDAWKSETERLGKNARMELFKAYHYHKKRMKRDGDKFLKQSGIEHQAAVSPADNTEQTLISSSASEVCCPLPDARHPILQAIDKASQGQLDRCLDGVIIKEEGGTAVLVCRNKFIADSLRRYEEIVESAVKASGFQSYAVRSADQPMTSILKPDNFIESSVEKNGTLRITTKPIPASLTEEAKKELTQRIRERVKEIETEHLQNWQQSRALAAVTD